MNTIPVGPDTRQLTREESVAFHDSKAYETMSMRERAIFQLNQKRLCMPMSTFHEAVEKSIGRPVFTHEFASCVNLLKELLGEKPAPTFEEIMNLIPAEKRVLIIKNESPA